jgi:predicted nuclease of predicted toxin-antitoxin system
VRRVLADENCERSVVDALRGDGHEVIWAAEVYPSAEDLELYEIAFRERLLFLTQDQDFSVLQRFQSKTLVGLIVLRLGRMARVERAQRVASVLHEHSASFDGHFTVIEPAQIRTRTLGL